MKQFNLEEYLANPSKRVVTRNGRNARIVCTDKQGTYHCIVALVKETHKETIISCLINGRQCNDKDSIYDLFFVTKKHEGWVNIYRDSILSGPCYKGIYPSEEEAKRNACFDAVATVKIEWEE